MTPALWDRRIAAPSQHVEENERILDAAKRQTLEEVNIHLTGGRIKGIIHSNADREYLHFVILAKHHERSGEARNIEPGQCDHMDWRQWGRWPDNTPYPAYGWRWRTLEGPSSSENTSPTTAPETRT